MKKEIIIVICLIILIVIGHICTQNYTKKIFDEIIYELSVLKKSIKDNNITNESMKNEFNKIQTKWDEKYNNLAYYIEHDELEKVGLQLVCINSNIENGDYEQCIEEIDKCKFILDHIKDKDSLKLVNVF